MAGSAHRYSAKEALFMREMGGQGGREQDGAPSGPPMKAGRAVAMCVGRRWAPHAAAQIARLRNAGCRTPVRVCHCDGELGQEAKDALSALPDVRVIDICRRARRLSGHGGYGFPVTGSTRRYRSWFCKPLAVAFLSQTEVMMVDIDSIFLVNPDVLWQSAAYRRTGTLFFRDLPLRPSTQSFIPGLVRSEIFMRRKVRGAWLVEDLFPRLWNLSVVRRGHTARAALGARAGSASYIPSGTIAQWKLDKAPYVQDSSVVLWDKGRQPRASAVLADLITFHPNYCDSANCLTLITAGGIDAWSYGDKEFYWTACEAANTEYAWSPWAAAMAGRAESREGYSASGPFGLCELMAHHVPPPETSGAAVPGTAPLLHLNAESFAEQALPDPPTHATRPRLASDGPRSAFCCAEPATRCMDDPEWPSRALSRSQQQKLLSHTACTRRVLTAFRGGLNGTGAHWAAVPPAAAECARCAVLTDTGCGGE
eukprot:TRINITY_DN36799_c0_g1_i2.p2 TRINITY_DN36799_c0_g1~~TRINITY_DN36799_c0_g1_i2.p2  ORF type:complete len:482 (+),score=104.63 TRINITY_DN36799_c0_g1_i2:1755-3200(+)